MKRVPSSSRQVKAKPAEVIKVEKLNDPNRVQFLVRFDTKTGTANMIALENVDTVPALQIANVLLGLRDQLLAEIVVATYKREQKII